MHRFLIASLLLSFNIAWPQTSVAQSISSKLRGDWTLVRSSGVRLPKGNCNNGQVDKFSVRFNRLKWIPPRKLRLPSLTLSMTNPFVPFGKNAQIKVRDRDGVTGNISLTGDTMVHRYSNNVSLRFRRCL